MTEPSVTRRRPASVVVASRVGPPFIDDCLASVERQARELDAEVVVAAGAEVPEAERIQRQFPWARVIHVPGRPGIPRLRRTAAEAAAGDIIAVIEEHKVAAEGWLRAALTAHAAGAYAAVGGPVNDGGYERIRDWVVYLAEYNDALPPTADADVSALNGANIAYRREVLHDHLDHLDAGYWESRLHPVLLSEGQRFRSVPGMVVYHRGPFGLRAYWRQRFWFSRAFAGSRRDVPAGHRVAYLLAAPLVPGLLLARIGWRVWRKRRYVGRFALAIPLLVPTLVVLVAGEWIGYLVGAGAALAKVE